MVSYEREKWCLFTAAALHTVQTAILFYGAMIRKLARWCDHH